MRRIFLVLFAVLLAVLPLGAFAQTWSTVTASNIYDPSSGPNKLAFGTLKFTATDAKGVPLEGYNAGDGVAINAPIKCPIASGAVSNCRVPNPATTIPPNIAYMIEVISSKGTAKYAKVSFVGDFNLDTYVPSSAPIYIGQSVDRLTVGELTITKNCVGCGEGGAGSAGVASFNGRNGAVTPQTNDYSWSQIASKPSTFTPSTHNHTKSEVTDFPTTWPWGSLTGVPSTFTPSAHNQAFTTITGVLDLAQMPNCTVDGQVAKRVSGAWQCAADSTGTGGASGVSSFNGATGDVTYAPAWNDVTSKPTEFTPSAHNQDISTITGLQTALDGKQAAGSYAAANASTTVNGQTCALGGSCTITTGSSLPALTENASDITSTKEIIAPSFKTPAGGGPFTVETTPGSCTVSTTGKFKMCVSSSSNRLMFSYDGSSYSAAMQASDFAVVAVTGAYGDLIDEPTLGTAAAANLGTGASDAAYGNHNHSGIYEPVGPANVTTTVGTTAIAANTCTSAVTVTMTGLTTAMTFAFTPTSDTSGVTGWGSTGGLVIVAWPTANTLNVKVCNQTGASITPSASVTFNVSAR